MATKVPYFIFNLWFDVSVGFCSCAPIGVFVEISLSIVTINNWVKLGHRVIMYKVAYLWNVLPPNMQVIREPKLFTLQCATLS